MNCKNCKHFKISTADGLIGVCQSDMVDRDATYYPRESGTHEWELGVQVTHSLTVGHLFGCIHFDQKETNEKG